MPPSPPPSEPAPACHRNLGSPADRALTTIVSLLATDGFSFSIPSWDGDAYLRIGTAVDLLDPDHTRPVPAVPREYADAPLLGSILHALSRYGFTVTVTETGADTRFVLTVTNPAQPWRGSIIMTGDGELQWKARAPHHRDGGIPLPDVAATITRAQHPAVQSG